MNLNTARFFPVMIMMLCANLSNAADDPHAHHRMHDANADDPHAHHKAMAKATPQESMAKVSLPDISLLNQDGKQIALQKDLMADRIVVVNFAYTTCTTVCPVTSSIFSMLQKRLGDVVGKKVELITITVDPTRDTPHKLLQYSKKFSSGKGWTWLTGDIRKVEKVLDAFGAYTPNFEDHPAMVLIGNTGNSEWYRYYGFPAPDKLEQRVRSLLNSSSNG